MVVVCSALRRFGDPRGFSSHHQNDGYRDDDDDLVSFWCGECWRWVWLTLEIFAAPDEKWDDDVETRLWGVRSRRKCLGKSTEHFSFLFRQSRVFAKDDHFEFMALAKGPSQCGSAEAYKWLCQ